MLYTYVCIYFLLQLEYLFWSTLFMLVNIIYHGQLDHLLWSTRAFIMPTRLLVTHNKFKYGIFHNKDTTYQVYCTTMINLYLITQHL
jgi:hypothetical protein